MSYKNTYFRNFARTTLVLFMMNTMAPTLQFAFADSTQYYVDATNGLDTNDGLSPGQAWQTLAKVNGTTLLQGDTVSLLCGETWTESLTLNSTNGGVGLPITINGYSGCTSVNKPKIDSISMNASSEIVVNGIDVSTPTIGNSIDMNASSSVTFMNNTVSNGSGVCMNITNSTAMSVNGNIFSGCEYGMNVNTSEGVINGNTFSTIAQDAITLSSALPIAVTQNTFSNIAQSAIIYGQDSDITQNTITNTCSTSSIGCAAIKNNAALSGSVITATVTENTINGVGSGISGNRNYGIFTSDVGGATITYNNVINAEVAIALRDSHTSTITNNTLLTSRAKTFTATQTSSGTSYGNTLNENNFLQKNPDYPYIEIRDEVPGSNMADSIVSASTNSIYPLYKPNTSYIRTVNFGGFTHEYTKPLLNQFDAGISKFEYFAYKPYTFTGSYATANLLSNPNFDTDETLWTVAADTGLSPTLSHNAVGTYSGGSATITPAGGVADRLWMTNDATLSVTSGQTYLITGYAKSSTGTINLRGFLHSSSNKNTLYSDRIAETYASATGNLFSFYITVNTTAADAQFTLETSNQDVSYEVDSVSLRRMNAVVKNNTANEVLIFSNTGGVAYGQPCPGGVPCAAYVDTANVTTAWPINIAPYSTIFTLWNASTNILNVPSCTLNLSSGSLPTGEPVTATWNLTNSLSQTLHYSTYTGSIDESVAYSGSRTFIPPYDAVTTISVDSLNDVGPGICSIQVTTTNTAPTINPGTTTGTEDAIQIDGTLSGVDLNPGDSIFFEQFGTMPTNGVLNVESSGSFQYYPNPEFCGNDSFEFRAKDQLDHTADPVFQTVQVDCVNDTPTVIGDTATGFATVPKIIDVIANDTDVDTPYQAQTFSIYGYTVPTNGTVSIIGNQIEYTGNVGFSGSDSLQYSIIDQSGAISNTGTLNLNISIINNPPVVSNSGFTFDEDTTLNASVTGSDIDGNPLTFTTTSLPAHGTLTLLTNGSLTYVPDGNYFGTDSFDYRANDGSLDSATGTITLNINTIADSYGVNQDTLITLPVMNNDVDIDSILLTFTGYTNPTHGTLTLVGTGFEYMPNTGYVGPDSFAYALEDDTSLISNTVTVTLNVNSTNTAPTAHSGAFTLNEDDMISDVVTGTDPELSTLTFVLDTAPTHGVLTLSNTGIFTYTPNGDYAGFDSFVFHVSDGILDSSGATIAITVSPINDTPTADPYLFTATGNTMLSSGNIYSGILMGSDVESVVSFTAATLPVNGILNMTSTGVFTYTPALGYTGSDSFTFTVSDGIVSSIPATVDITIVDNLSSGSGSGSGSSSGTGSSGSGSGSGSGGSGGSGGGSYSLPPAVTLAGGGGGGGAGSSQSFPVYTITPVAYTGTSVDVPEEETLLSAAPESNITTNFVLYDPSGLLSQLFFMNRYVSASGTPMVVSGEVSDTMVLEAGSKGSVIDTIDTMEFDDVDGPILLREIARMFISETNTLEDPIEMYDYGIMKIMSIPSDSASRLDLTKNYIIRLFSQQQKRYQEAIERNISLKSEDNPTE